MQQSLLMEFNEHRKVYVLTSVKVVGSLKENEAEENE